MTISRRFTLSAHGAAEFVAGLAMMLAPAILSFGVTGAIVSVVLGALLTGNALNLVTTPGRSLVAHTAFDSAFLLATAVAALGLAAAGQASAGAIIFLAVIVMLEAGLSFSTRYVAAN
jgi:hypothetical protein